MDGDYVYGPCVQGVFYRGGLILDFDDDPDVHGEDEWTNANLRESIAKSCLVRTRKLSSTNYFTKGKVSELGLFLKEQSQINVVYINADLTAVQIKKLQKRFNDIIMDREERIRAYNISSANKDWEISPTESDTTAMSDFGGNWQGTEGVRRIRVIDRFGMILQIFAARARTQIAQL